MSGCVNVDCEKGREKGCQTYCCRLLVRLEPDERKPGIPQSFVEKGADGYCANLDRETHFCRTWEQRPRVCRSYDCNSDFLLQVAVRNTFRDIAELAKLAATAYIPKETYIQVISDGET